MAGSQTKSLEQKIDEFLSAPSFAVAGASDDVNKYGYKVYSCYLQNGRKAYPINPRVEKILGNPSFKTIDSLPEKVESISIITPPQVTEKVVEEAIAAGVKNVWMQPGAESQSAIEKAEQAGLNVIAGGPCVLVVMGYHGH